MGHNGEIWLDYLSKIIKGVNIMTAWEKHRREKAKQSVFIWMASTIVIVALSLGIIISLVLRRWF